MRIELQKSQKFCPQNNSQTVTNEHDKGIPKLRYISSEERQNYWWSEINITV